MCGGYSHRTSLAARKSQRKPAGACAGAPNIYRSERHRSMRRCWTELRVHVGATAASACVWPHPLHPERFLRSAGVLKDAHLAPQPSHIKFVPPHGPHQSGRLGRLALRKDGSHSTLRRARRNPATSPSPSYLVLVVASFSAPPSIDSSVGRSRGRGTIPGAF